MLIATASFNPLPPCIDKWLELCVDEHMTMVWNNSEENVGVPLAYEGIRNNGIAEPIICYTHDDVSIHERGWDRRILHEFDDPKVAICGMGGALGIGHPDIYRKPYQITHLIRSDYYSNQTDWQTHGKQETGSRDVAVVDGFCMAVRRSFLDRVGGWKWQRTNFHCYDTAMSMMALRHGWKVRMVGISATHHGGGTSTTPAYLKWCEENGTDAGREHREPHLWLYEEFKDVMPYRVNQ